MNKLITLFIIIASANAFTNENNDKTCEKLYIKAIHKCSVIMCKDWLKDQNQPITKANINDCLSNSDGDLREGAQICATDEGVFDSLVNKYNKKNPENRINCEHF